MSKITAAAKGFIRTGIILPAACITMVHLAGMITDDHICDDYSLAHRFETAYSFKTPKSHREYTIQPMASGYDYGEPKKHKYMASPWATWPLTLVLGFAGAADALDAEKKKMLRNKDNTR